jgi:nucleoside 2-deoxyribosyltransferase
LATDDIEPIDVFISHADKERKVAGRLKRGLENIGLNAFVAHDDIVGGTDWNPALIERIEKCDIFVALISEAYRKADFTDQEAGIAFAMKKPIIPISLDGTMPYGFIKKFQA